ncbi:uncharacterized protein LOC131162001 [Malania oleifera]|uniref:uncharacterized protein LOC131162001 n=1 Tax=Malania oleifera TaxID=397392 RepID=UPI0025AEC4C0|nr:uncharacterized protein LOC131162001 [Malania oleifera]
MDLRASWTARATGVSVSPTTVDGFHRPSRQNHKLSFSFCPCPSTYAPYGSCIAQYGKRNAHDDPVVKPTIVEVSMDDEDKLLLDDVEDGEYVEEDAEVYAGDGGGGGGISLAGTWWDKEALAIAEKVSLSFDGQLKIYAFKTLATCTIKVRIETMSNKSGSPSMSDIENFSSAYRARLDKAELAGSVPGSLTLEVSSPGVERVVRVPEELDRFKERAMYVRYTGDIGGDGSSTENDGVFRLISFDMEAKCCTWGLADVRINREKAGKGRPLSKKQREWRLNTPLHSLRMVRLYSDC